MLTASTSRHKQFRYRHERICVNPLFDIYVVRIPEINLTSFRILTNLFLAHFSHECLLICARHRCVFKELHRVFTVALCNCSEI